VLDRGSARSASTETTNASLVPFPLSARAGSAGLPGECPPVVQASQSRSLSYDPPMDQVRYGRENFGTVTTNLFAFDGVVLEIFGLTQAFGVSQLSQRFHRDLMTIAIEEPDRKGARRVEIKAGGSGCEFKIANQEQAVIDFPRTRSRSAAGRLTAHSQQAPTAHGSRCRWVT